MDKCSYNLWNFQPIKVFIWEFCEYNMKEALKISAGKILFWSETSLVSLGVKSIRSLIRITRCCSLLAKAILVHIHWGRFSNWFWILRRERWRGNQGIMWISERIAFVSPRTNGFITSPCWENVTNFSNFGKITKKFHFNRASQHTHLIFFYFLHLILLCQMC